MSDLIVRHNALQHVPFWNPVSCIASINAIKVQIEAGSIAKTKRSIDKFGKPIPFHHQVK